LPELQIQSITFVLGNGRINQKATAFTNLKKKGSKDTGSCVTSQPEVAGNGR
jgi:hypothetical protein